MKSLATKRILLALLVLVLSTLGCRRGAAASGDGPVVIRFWNGFTGPDGETMRKIVRGFNSTHKDVQVEMEIIPWGTFYDKVTLSLAFGGAPDLFVLHTGRFPEYASHDVLAPLDDRLNTAGLNATMYPKPTWAAASWKGQQLALPLDIHPLTLYYNKDLFAKGGVTEPPKTYEEFLATAKRLTKDTDGDGTIDQWGFAFTNLASNSTLFMNQNGTAMLSPNLDRSALGDAGSRKAYAEMLDLIYNQKIAPKPEGLNAWMLFQTGKAAMVMEGVYMNAGLERQAGFNYGGVPVPQFGPKPAVWAGSHMLVMPKDGEARQQAAAWTFAKYLSDNSIEWAKGGQVPARNDLRTKPEFLALPVQAAVATQIDRIEYEPASVSINLVATFRDSMIEKILNRLGPEDQAIADAERRANTVLERQKGAQ